MSRQVISTGSSHSWFIDGDNGAVGVTDETGVRDVADSMGVDSTVSDGSMGVEGEVVSPSSGHSWLI